ncbi:MAG: single-stranded DNA-binding protein [Micrococcaceae bacterium]
MPENFTVRGWIATDIRSKVSEKGVPIVTFRLACPERKYNKETDIWEDMYTSWFTIVAFRRLATHAALSLHKGDRIVVHGKLRVREWNTPETKGVTAELVADSIGHDLAWGTSFFSKNYGKKTETVNALAKEKLDAEGTLITELKNTSGHFDVENKTLIPCDKDGVICEDCDAQENSHCKEEIEESEKVTS